jgi:hypothetical protein
MKIERLQSSKGTALSVYNALIEFGDFVFQTVFQNQITVGGRGSTGRTALVNFKEKSYKIYDDRESCIQTNNGYSVKVYSRQTTQTQDDPKTKLECMLVQNGAQGSLEVWSYDATGEWKCILRTKVYNPKTEKLEEQQAITVSTKVTSELKAYQKGVQEQLEKEGTTALREATREETTTLLE